MPGAKGLMARFWGWLIGLVVDAFRQQGRVEVEQAQKETADAVRADYDAIHSDGRTFDDAVGGLSKRAAQRKPPDHGNRS